jgi:hypothetical protein
MMPQLGVLSTVHEQAAAEVFDRDCLIRLGTVIAPVGRGKEGQPCVRVKVEVPGGAKEADVRFGDMALLPLPEDGEVRVKVTAEPDRGFDVGAGKGKSVTREVRGGVVGLIVDARGRQPFELPAEPKKRIERLRLWNRTLGIYPKEL